MIKGIARNLTVILLDTTGAPVTGVTPTVQIKIDTDAWKAATNAASASDASGRSTILLDAGEMTGDNVAVHWVGTGAVPIIQNVGLDDASLFKADVSNLDVAVSTRQAAVTDVDGLTLEQALRVCLAALAGKIAGAPSGPINIRDQADTKNRISATVDANGNRTAVTVDAT